MDNVNNLNELWYFMKENIQYGWTNKNHEVRQYGDSRQGEEYFLHSSEETLKSGYGICLDQVEVEKEFCRKKGIQFKTISFNFKNEDGSYKNSGHTFLVANEDGKWKYFERAFEPCLNLVEFESLEEAIATPIACYMSCYDSLKLEDIDFMNIYLNPNYKPGMNTQEIFEIEFSAQNIKEELCSLLKEKYRELNLEETAQTEEKSFEV